MMWSEQVRRLKEFVLVALDYELRGLAEMLLCAPRTLDGPLEVAGFEQDVKWRRRGCRQR